MITAVIVMDHYDRGFTKHGVEGKVFNPFPRISPGKERKTAVAHNCNVPKLGKNDCTPARACRNDVIIYRRDKIGALQRTHGSFRKDALRKYHDSIMTNSGNGFMAIHPVERLLSLPIQALPIGATEFCPGVIAAVN